MGPERGGVARTAGLEDDLGGAAAEVHHRRRPRGVVWVGRAPRRMDGGARNPPTGVEPSPRQNSHKSLCGNETSDVCSVVFQITF